MSDTYKPRTMVSPDGREFEASSARNEADLVVGHGYKYKDPDAELPTQPDADPSETMANADDRPPLSAPKPDWVEFAKTQGVDAGEAENSTKAELIDRFTNG